LDVAKNVGNRLAGASTTTGDASFDTAVLKFYAEDTAGRIYSFDRFQAGGFGRGRDAAGGRL